MLTKTRAHLNELKQAILSFKESNTVLQSEAHALSLYFKKSEMLQSEGDSRTRTNILEMETPMCRLIIRILRGYGALSEEN